VPELLAEFSSSAYMTDTQLSRLKRIPGIDKITAKDFEENLDRNIEKLRDELKAQTFQPDPVRRVYIPKKKWEMETIRYPYH
jgi:retron-type reverse transcriptase